MIVFRWAGRLAPYAAAVALCATALCIVLQLWRADLGIPIRSNADALSTQAFVKTLLEKGAYYHTERAGAPFGMELRDFPLPESLTFAELRILAFLLGTRNPFLVINCFFLLTFFLTTLAALFVLRRFRVATAPALAASLLYAFVPYHFFRGVLHLFLAAYYLVPLTVMAALWLYLGRLNAPWRGRRAEADAGRNVQASAGAWRRWLFAVPLCLLLSSGGVYYAFFGCFFFFAAALACCVRERRIGPLVAGGTLAAVVAFGMAVNMLPFLSFQKQHGVNPMVASRAPAEAEIYGLKMTELFLPASGHRIREFRRVKEHYVASPGMPLINDYGDGLGLVGVVGFVFVLGAVLFRTRAPKAFDGRENALTPAALGSLSICGLLLGAIGGLGSLFAFFISPMIRCYDRISIYLSFMALFGAALLLDAATRRLARSGWVGRLGGGLLCLLVLAGGLFDQTTANDVPPYEALKAEHESIRGFIAALERTLPPGAMILQLPFIRFPEASPVNRMGDGDHLRMYVNSDSLRWSHGAVKGRLGSDVLSLLCAAPIDKTLEHFAAMGYQGIHVDRRGYADRGQALEAQLCALLERKPLVSADGRDVFFDIRPYTERVKSRYSEAQWQRRREWTSSPVVMRWGTGFLVEGFDGNKHWRHSGAGQAEATIINPSKEPRPVTLRFRAYDYEPVPRRLTLSGPLMEEAVQIEPPGTEFSRTFLAPPGETALHFHCDAAPITSPMGVLAFTLMNYDLVNEPPADAESAAGL